MRKFNRRVIAAALAFAGCAALAQDYPNRPIKLMVPAATAGLTDYVGRLFGQKLSERLGQPVVVENKPGAGGNIGADVTAKAAPDGYSLLLGFASPLVVNQWLYKNMPFDAQRDLAPVAMLVSYPLVLAVNNAVPAKTVPELVSLMKRDPKAISMGSAGNATTSHLILELLKKGVGVDLLHVPYKGETPSLTGVLSNDIQGVFATGAVVMPQHKAGKLRALAVTSKERSRSFPEIPTLAEGGLKDFDAVGWIGILAPAGTPQPIVDRLSRELVAIVRDPAVQKDLIARGMDPIGIDAAAFGQRMQSERAMWQRVINDAKIKPE